MPGETKGPQSPEELAEIKKAKAEAQLAYYAELAAEMDKQNAPPEIKRECGPEIVKFDELIVAFEQEHSLEALHLIIDLKRAEAPEHPVREPARKALAPVFAQLKVLKLETDIPEERLLEIKQDYKRLSMAVGVINNDKVDHTR